MSVEIIVKPDTKAIRKAFERLRKVGSDPRMVLGQIGLFVRRAAQRRLRARRSEFGRGKGKLSKSLTMRVTASLVRVGSPLIYAAVQQLGTSGLPGGVIRAKPPRKFLALPVDPQLRRRGVWPRDLPAERLKFVRAADIRIGNRRWTGRALVDPEDGRVLFALVRTVRVKGRPYLKFDSEEQVFAIRAFRRAYLRAVGVRR